MLITCLVGPRQCRNFSSLPWAQLQGIRDTMQCACESFRWRMRGRRRGKVETKTPRDACIGCATRSPTIAARKNQVIGYTIPVLLTDLGPRWSTHHILPRTRCHREASTSREEAAVSRTSECSPWISLIRLLPIPRYLVTWLRPSCSNLASHSSYYILYSSTS